MTPAELESLIDLLTKFMAAVPNGTKRDTVMQVADMAIEMVEVRAARPEVHVSDAVPPGTLVMTGANGSMAVLPVKPTAEEVVLQSLGRVTGFATSDLSYMLHMSTADTRKLLDRMERDGKIESYRVQYQRDKSWRIVRPGGST